MTRLLVILALVWTVPASALVETPASPLTFGPIRPFGPPALATDGENYFAVWQDIRDPDRPGIYGARITPDRRLLDPAGVRLMDSLQAPVAVAYGGGRYLVVEGNLRFVVVDREVNVLARGRIAGDTAATVRPFFNGREFLVFWDTKESLLRSAAIDTEGRIAGEPATLLERIAALQLHDVTSDGSRVLLTYAHGTTLYAAATSMTGAPLWFDRPVAADTYPWLRSSIASADGSILVAWRSPENVQAARLDAEGRVVAGPRVVIPWQAPPVKVVATGSGFRMFEAQELRVMSYDIQTDLITPTVVPAIDRPRPWRIGWFAAIAGPGGTFVVAEIGHAFTAESGLYAADGDLTAEPQLVSRAGTTQRLPDVAAGDDGTMVVWHEQESPRVRATFFGAGMTATLDAGVAQWRISPSVAAQGDTYLVAWSDQDAARARLMRGGSFLGGAITLAEAAFHPAAAADGRDFVVVSTRFRSFRIARVTTDGQIVATAEVPYQLVVRAPVPEIACDRGQCVLVWVEQIPLVPGCFSVRCSYQERVMALPLDADLRPLYATPLVLSDLTGARELSVAAEEGTYAVTWERFGAVYARTIGRGGALGKLLVLPGTNPAVVRQAGAWLLVREVGDDLAAVHFDSEGTRGERVLARDGQRRDAPALARRGTDAVMVYERTTHGEEAGGVVRVYVTTLDAAAPKRRAVRH